MASGHDIIKYGKQFLGEGSSRFTKAYGVSSGTAWCVIYVWYVLRHFGTAFPFWGKKTAYVPTAQQWLHQRCKWVKLAEARAGDIAIFCWSGAGGNGGSGSRDHIGFIISRNSNGTFQTLEGNTSGSRVAIRTRSPKNIRNIYRPTGLGSTSSTSTSSGSSSSGSTYRVGKTYRLTADMRVRTGPGTNYRQKKRTELTADGKRHALAGTYACLKTGTKVDALEIRGNWMRIPSGWICIRQGSKVYVK